ncbi:piggyBac transposable element-derived protein 4-like [Vespula squamosa]|uniref:PiggyBac transposable element-derived protein 4-like n=1 Tax=Vespula squamosa TaxID=30214 RepID=A0ABD2BYF9_VESSQ
MPNLSGLLGMYCVNLHLTFVGNSCSSTVRFISNVIKNNFFTNTSLETKLLSKRITLLGLTTLFAYFINQIIALYTTIYKSKLTKNITILGSKHKSVQINNDRKRIPEIVAAYYSNSVSMSPIKWQESTTSNQNSIDGLQQFLLQIAEEVAEDYHRFFQEGKENV